MKINSLHCSRFGILSVVLRHEIESHPGRSTAEKKVAQVARFVRDGNAINCPVPSSRRLIRGTAPCDRQLGYLYVDSLEKLD